MNAGGLLVVMRLGNTSAGNRDSCHTGGCVSHSVCARVRLSVCACVCASAAAVHVQPHHMYLFIYLQFVRARAGRRF